MVIEKKQHGDSSHEPQLEPELVEMLSNVCIQ